MRVFGEEVVSEASGGRPGYAPGFAAIAGVWLLCSPCYFPVGTLRRSSKGGALKALSLENASLLRRGRSFDEPFQPPELLLCARQGSGQQGCGWAVVSLCLSSPEGRWGCTGKWRGQEWLWAGCYWVPPSCGTVSGPWFALCKTGHVIAPSGDFN